MLGRTQSEPDGSQNSKVAIQSYVDVFEKRSKYRIMSM